MPMLIEMRLKASWQVRPSTRQLHGLACALFEGDGAGHAGQDKPFAVWPLWPLRPASGGWRMSGRGGPPGCPPACPRQVRSRRTGSASVTCHVL